MAAVLWMIAGAGLLVLSIYLWGAWKGFKLAREFDLNPERGGAFAKMRSAYVASAGRLMSQSAQRRLALMITAMPEGFVNRVNDGTISMSDAYDLCMKNMEELTRPGGPVDELANYKQEDSSPAGSEKSTLATDTDLMQRLVKTVSLFMTASTVLVNQDELTRNRHKQFVVYSYAFGALDALAQANHLDQTATLAAALVFFTDYFELKGAECGYAVRNAMDATMNPAYRTWIEAGGRAILEWPQDQNAPLRLFELLQSISDVEHAKR